MLSAWILFGFYIFLTGVRQGETSNHYHLYNERKDDWPEVQADGEVIDSIWHKGKDVKVIVHGFNPSPEKNLSPFQVIAIQNLFILAKEYSNLYLNFEEKVNIIMVDWTDLATESTINYPTAAANTYPAGTQIAHFLIELKENGYITDWSQVHMLGHSLGAHTAAVAGYMILKLQNGEKVARITGLDPAGPEFTVPNKGWPADMTRVLDYTDADFVDIIHTNAGPYKAWFFLSPLIWGTFGSDLASGHVDFYPNGGSHMPQCNQIKDRLEFCSHQQSVLYFAYALRNYKNTNLIGGCPCTAYLYYVLGLCPCSYPESGEIMGHFTRPYPAEPRRTIYLVMAGKNINKSYFD